MLYVCRWSSLRIFQHRVPGRSSQSVGFGTWGEAYLPFWPAAKATKSNPKWATKFSETHAGNVELGEKPIVSTKRPGDAQLSWIVQVWVGAFPPSVLWRVEGHSRTSNYIISRSEGAREGFCFSVTLWHFSCTYKCAGILPDLAAAAKSLQSYLTLCDPIDGSPPGSPIPGILQARTLEWVAMSFSNAWKWKVKVKSLSCVRLLVTPWTAAHQAPPSMGFSRQQYWSGVPLPSPFYMAGRYFS